MEIILASGSGEGHQYSFALLLLSPLKKAWPSIWIDLKNPSPKDVVEIGLKVLEEKMKMWKVYNATYANVDR